MSIEILVYFTSALIILLICLCLAFDPIYPSKIVRFIGLAVLILPQAVMLSDGLLRGSYYDVLPGTVASHVGFAVFLVCHFVAFRRWRSTFGAKREAMQQ